MVFLAYPKFIKKTWVHPTPPLVFRQQHRRADAVAVHATCMRCAQSISKQERRCQLPEHRRCKYCADNNRGGCTKLPTEFNGRANRLYQLRALYDAAVAAAANPRTDAEVRKTGVKLARVQRQFNLELTHNRRRAAHTGTPIGVPTQVPTTTPQYLSLILVEQRRMAAAMETIARHAATIADADMGDPDNQEGQEEESDDENAANLGNDGGEQEGGDEGAGGANDQE